MPYVTQKERPYLETISEMEAQTAGQLNYQITRLVTEYVKRKGTNYANINEVIGVLEAAKLEFYRRLAGPYEDTKITQNGDVY